MSEDIHRKLTAFLSAQFGRTEGRQCIQLDLMSMTPGGGGETMLGTWDRAEDPAPFESLAGIEDLVTAIIARSQDHADALGTGSHKFGVRTKQHLGARLFHGFLLHSTSDTDGMGSSDPPNATGIVGQSIRHTEVMMRMQMAMTQATVGALERQNASLADECLKLREERRQHLAELEQARSSQDERQYAMTIGMAADERKSQAVAKVLQLLPVLATGLMGKGEGGGAGGTGSARMSPLAILIVELGKSISGEQMAQLQATLSMEQQLLLIEALKIAQAAQAAQAAAESKDASNASAGADGAGRDAAKAS